jgi:bifunctional UDP-N-acetylglucosamine pyrophosphorylase / glucosamine-1-phosphate N-acetyltransferase
MTDAGNPLAVVVLAAGQGTRMRSDRAKVLHELAGRPLLGHPVALAEALRPEELVVVIGRDAEQVEAAFAGRARFVVQQELRGTGHAVQQVEPLLRDFRGDVLILYGDVPLLREESVRRLLACRAETGADLVMLTAPIQLPGLVVRGPDGRVARIVEVTDASPEELRIQEGNTGVYLVGAELLWKALGRLDDRNQQGELYLTDVVEQAVAEGRRVEAIRLDDPDESLGVNDRRELAQAAAVLRRRTVERLMAGGVTFVDPASSWIDVDVEIGRDTVVEPGVRITGATRIGQGCHIKPHCTIEASEIGDGCEIGPSAHLRPGCRLAGRVRIGNFVEVKNSVLAEGVKADHLSYVGDADVGPGASFGAGSITVNYDWEKKHRTRVGARARIGCNANLVAPLEIEPGAFVAAGTTVTKTVPTDAIAVSTGRQRNLDGWGARRRRGGPADGAGEPEKKSS